MGARGHATVLIAMAERKVAGPDAGLAAGRWGGRPALARDAACPHAGKRPPDVSCSTAVASLLLELEGVRSEVREVRAHQAELRREVESSKRAFIAFQRMQLAFAQRAEAATVLTADGNLPPSPDAERVDGFVLVADDVSGPD